MHGFLEQQISGHERSTVHGGRVFPEDRDGVAGGCGKVRAAKSAAWRGGSERHVSARRGSVSQRGDQLGAA
jgi:hypothetical protein